MTVWKVLTAITLLAIRSGSASAGKSPAVEAAYGRLPLSFEPNRGQTDPQVRFLAHPQGMAVFLSSSGAVISLLERPHPRTAGRRVSPAWLRMQFLGGRSNTEVEGREPLLGRVNYFVGKDPSSWHTDIPTFSKVVAHNVYPGIDVIYYGHEGRLEYDFVIQPGADPTAIRFAIEGARGLRIDRTGDLVIDIGGRSLLQRRPRVYQVQGGIRREIAGSYVLLGHHRVAFRTESYDPALALVIDPVLDYSTYLGGSQQDWAYAIAVDSVGSAYIAGMTNSTDFPLLHPIQATYSGGMEMAFVAKLNCSGTALVYSTYLGGNAQSRIAQEEPRAIAVDARGNAYVTGWTASNNFPLMNPFQATFAGGNPGSETDAFVTKLSATGSALIYSTYLGGSGTDSGHGIAVDGEESAYVVGDTDSTNFPTANPLQGTTRGEQDAFVTKFNAAGSALAYSTYLGGSRFDGASAVAVDSAGQAFVAGGTGSTDFPITAGSLQTSYGGNGDAFVAKLNPAGSTLVYSTYLGGSSNLDAASAIAVDSGGNACVAGDTFSVDFPTNAGAVQRVNRGSGDAFVTKINATGRAFVYSTYLGGGGLDQAKGIAGDSAGNCYVAGSTFSTDFVTKDALQATIGGLGDAFVSALDPLGSTLVYSTYLGGKLSDFAYAIQVDGMGSVYVAGGTSSTDFPITPRALQPTLAGHDNAFVVKLGSGMNASAGGNCPNGAMNGDARADGGPASDLGGGAAGTSGCAVARRSQDARDGLLCLFFLAPVLIIRRIRRFGR